MLTDDLFEQVLITPATQKGVNKLQIVSGFATAGMADRHMEKLAKLQQQISIELIVGMTPRSGIEIAQHYAMQKLVNTRPYGMDFSCRYVVSGNPVHAKTYCWMVDDKPEIAFTGSANYTLTGFGQTQIEVIEDADCNDVVAFHAATLNQTADCIEPSIDQKITLTQTNKTKSTTKNTVTLPLLDKKTGDTPPRSGINWGQRLGRDKDQAYINIPSDIGRSGFFPDRGERFTVLTDDNQSFIMVRAQDGGKGLETTQNNSLLGEYLRGRMGVPSGQYVTLQDLTTYGRTDVAITKIDDETYLLDFRP